MARPKSFDPDTVLERAMAVFQEKGFEAASVADLTERMGINRFSMYDTFGDKRALYLAALDRYIASEVSRSTAPLREPDATLEDLRSWIVRGVRECRPEKRCMILRGAVECDAGDEEVAARVREAKSMIQRYFRDIVANEQSRGRVRADVDPDRAAWGLYAMHTGLATIATQGGTPLEAVVGDQIAALRA